MSLDIQKILKEFTSMRPLFHLEADFQHSLAWEIQQKHPNYSIRFEYKPPQVKERMFVDLWIKDDNGHVYAIELKYKTRSFNITLQDEEYKLLNHGAQDLGRYDFLKDVQRIEGLVTSNSKITGYAILLTNDASYWNSSTNNTVDQDFRLKENRIVHGELKWQKDASEGTTKGRKNPIVINGKYDLKWRDYSQISTTTNGKFRYLLIEIK